MVGDMGERITDALIAAAAMVPPCAEQVPPMEASKSRRCSLRYLGKTRPNYSQNKPENTEPEPKAKQKASRKRARMDHGKKKPSASLGPLYPIESTVTCDVGDPPVGEEATENGEGISIGTQNSVGKSIHVRVKETLRAFNTHHLHFVQEEEKRSKLVEAIMARSPKTSMKFPKASKHKLKKNDTKVQDGVSQLSDVSQPEESEQEEKRSKQAEAINERSLKTLKISHKASKPKVGDGCDVVKRASKRPDLKAISMMMNSKTILYPEKRIGHLPGINVGHQFFSRAEMVVLGLHSHWLNGIDYMGIAYAKMVQFSGRDYKFPLAVCIVLSGMYEDDVDNSDEVIYTGQGGHDLLGNKKQIGNQKLVRGNLALKHNMDCLVPVRVVRGQKSTNSYCGKVYTYDGLYQVQKYWVETGAAGYTVFKYKLKRQEGQPTLTTNQVHFTRAQAPKHISELRGLVCEDITGGQENFPIPATNVVDDPPFAPTDFAYRKSVQVAMNLNLPTNAGGCNCKGECIDPRICSCARLNGSDFPYVRRDGGRLVEAKAVVFECGPNCGCKLSCVNRTSQQGLKYRLEVFRTPKKGWAVRSWDTIPSGAPICEYTGKLMKTDDVESVLENNYIFDIDCLQTMKGLDGRERRPGDVSLLTNFDEWKSEAPEYCIDAGAIGNIARFINHSCQPNLFVQCVLSSHHDIKIAKVMLFAADTIPPLQELTYDYGYTLDSVVGHDGRIKRLSCYCGAADCRKRLY